MRYFTTEAAGALLETVAALLGCTLQGWRATVAEPAPRGSVLGFELDLTDSDGNDLTHTVFVETNPEPGEREGVAVLEDPEDGSRVAVWVYPKDPKLPALEATVFQHAAAHLLSRIGITVAEPELTVLSYRPGRRAVIRVMGPDVPVFLKVVRSGRAAPIVDRHQAFREAGVMVPEVLGWSDEGLIALAALPGVEAQTVAETLPDEFMRQVLALTERVSAVAVNEPARTSLVERLDWYANRLTAMIPTEHAAIDALCVRIGNRLEEGRRTPFPRKTIHGDLHLGQIFVDPESPLTITGVLDIDTAGTGDPADDAAALYGHLEVLTRHLESSGRSDAALRTRQLAAVWRDLWRREDDPGFRHRALAISATHLMGHALRQSTEAAATALLRRAEEVIANHAQ